MGFIIASIEPDGLNDLYNVLAAGGVSGEIYGRSVKIKTKKRKADSELTNLYLYSDEAMSKREYVVQKAKLIESLDEVTEQIGFASSDAWQDSITDEDFVQRASEFIIARNLTDRSYICYKRLAMSVDAGVLKSFIASIIDSIIILDGMVKTITFRNGLSHTFVFRGNSGE